MPLAFAGGIIGVLFACSATNFAGGTGKTAANKGLGNTSGDPGGGTGDSGGPGGETSGNTGSQIPWTQVQQACANEIAKYCSGKTSQADIDACLKTAAVSAGCANTLNQFNNPPGNTAGGSTSGNTEGGNTGGSPGGGTAGSPAGGTAGGNTALGTGGGTGLGSTTGIITDSGPSEGRADLLLTYSAYTKGDGDPSNTATMQFQIQGPTDQSPVTVNTGALPPPPSADTDSYSAASMQTVRIPNECVCGKQTSFKLLWSATGALGLFKGEVDTDDQYMWLMSRNPPGQPDSSRDTHWSDDATGVGPSGTNVMYMGEDHPAAGGVACIVPYFYCGTHSQNAACSNHPWDCMDDIRLRWQCDVSQCGQNAAGTDLDISGSANHTLDPTP